MQILLDAEASRRRLLALETYLAEHVLGPTGFVCSSHLACRSSAGERAFYEGQLHHVGRHYDLIADGRPMRIAVVGQEYGHPPSCVSVDQRSEDISARARDIRFRERTPHMRGTTSLLRLFFGLGLGSDHEGEFIPIAQDRVHIFDAFCQLNFLLCSAVDEGLKKGRSTSLMRRNCSSHFNSALEILEPTVIVAQGLRVREWIGMTLGISAGHGGDIEWAKIGQGRALILTFCHPSVPTRDNWGIDERRPYLLHTVEPTVKRAIGMLALGYRPEPETVARA